MGLDVSVFKNIRITEDIEDYSFEAYVVDENWNYKIKNLEIGKYYTGDCADASVSYAYSTHNRFREALLKIIGRNDLLLLNGKINWLELEKETNMPFYELINFADNEGCLDFEISTILYNNFIEWQDDAIKHFKDNNYFHFAQRYLEWLNVFKNGKEANSVVVFH